MPKMKITSCNIEETACDVQKGDGIELYGNRAEGEAKGKKGKAIIFL